MPRFELRNTGNSLFFSFNGTRTGRFTMWQSLCSDINNGILKFFWVLFLERDSRRRFRVTVKYLCYILTILVACGHWWSFSMACTSGDLSSWWWYFSRFEIAVLYFLCERIDLVSLLMSLQHDLNFSHRVFFGLWPFGDSPWSYSYRSYSDSDTAAVFCR